MKVRVEPDCENAPKKAAIRDWLIALAEGSVEEVAELLAPDVSWEHVGSETWAGIDTVKAKVSTELAEALSIDKLLSHGKEVAAEGELALGGGSRQRFAHLIAFSGHGKNAKIEGITTYTVEVVG